LSSPICSSTQLPVGCSVDPDSPLNNSNIASWSWSISGYTCGPECQTSSFSVTLSPGTYSVTLAVTDAQGSQSTPATGTIVVSDSLVFDGSQISKWSGNSFGPISSDSQGNLVALNFYSSCWPCFTIVAINPSTGQPSWEAPQYVGAWDATVGYSRVG